MSVGFDLMVVAACGIWILGLAHSVMQERKAQVKRYEDLKAEKISAHQSDIL